MRFIEIRGGLNLPVSNEEQRLLDLIESQETKSINKEELDERQAELARKLVSRGVLERIVRDESLHFVVSTLEDLWR